MLFSHGTGFLIKLPFLLIIIIIVIIIVLLTAAFKYQYVLQIWLPYLTKFVARYGGAKLERARDLFEQAMDGCPAAELHKLYPNLELPLPAYEMVIKASHTFNLLDARRAISVTERQRYILRVRTLSRAIAQSYLLARARLGFPMATPELRDEVLAKLKEAE